jgi:hypothetical protein
VPRSLGVGWWPRGALQKYLRVIRRTRTPSEHTEWGLPLRGSVTLFLPQRSGEKGILQPSGDIL